MVSYFRRLNENVFEPSEHVGGSWNLTEQHIAPPMGLLTHLLEKDHAARGGSLKILSINFDILGVLPMEPVEASIRVLRPGKTIELVEGTISHGGRPALVARAWFLAEGETGDLAGTPIEEFPKRETMPEWSPAGRWPGKFIASLNAAQIEQEPGQAKSWVSTKYDLLEGEEVSDTAKIFSVVDVANGTTPRRSPHNVMFPNLDLKVSLFRPAVGQWVGLDTSVTFNDNGFGLTHSILHDEAGPLGAATQALTVRVL